MSTSIQWEVLNLIATNFDPKTLATTSTVSKSWHQIMSSDHLWEHLATTHYPSLTHLRSTTNPPLPYHRLYNLGFISTKRRQLTPSKPLITLQNLLFIITITPSNSPPVTVIKPGNALSVDSNALFRFDIDVRDLDYEFGGLDGTKVTWHVVMGGYEGVFAMMDICEGRGGCFSGGDGCFWVDLPVVGCCGGGGGGGMVAEMRLRRREEGRKMVVVSVCVGVLSDVSWRYVGVDDGLRYLQYFLEP